MKRPKTIFSIFQKGSAIFMMVALLWLTISAPFVLASQQQMDKMAKTMSSQSPLSTCDDETNPFGNNTEEKAPSSTSFSEEYLHENHLAHHFFPISLQYHKGENADTYIAFHGELLVPPPNQA
jgi:hypothetical protein